MFALHYTSVKTPAEENKIFGLQVAVSGLVKAWFRHGSADKFHVLVGDIAAQREIIEAAAETGIDPARLMLLDSRRVHENFSKFEVIFRADPDPRNLLWQRQQLPGKTFAFCGLAHAISGLEGGRVLEQFCLAPSNEADAILCPSRAIASAIQAFWNNYADYLRARFKADFKCPVQLPVIPLGIDIEKFAARVTPEKRAMQRTMLGLTENDTALLWVGRLSHAIKAHPIAMFQAAERAAEVTGAPVHLIMQGYFVPKEAEAQFHKLAADVCRKARVHFIASNDPRFQDGLWAAGDIFLSLIDNMQESFGLTPIEAMAAGLPRVQSDWDGYRDSTTNGEDGFLIRTLTPPPGTGAPLSELLLNEREMYGGFLAKTALSTAVDIEMAAAALKILIEDKNKRRQMADKARARVKNTYDWRHIIPAYEALWRDLSEKRTAHPPLGEGRNLLADQSRQANFGEGSQRVAWPLVPDPFTMYAAYPTAALKESDKIHILASVDTIRSLTSHDINLFGLDLMIAPDDITKLINAVSAQNGISIREIFMQFPTADRSALWRTLGWLIKLGIMRAA